MRKSLIGLLAVAGLTLSACGGSSTSSDTTAAAGTSGNECTAGKTLAEGNLTIGTGNPAFSPWVENDAPEAGEGFEAAVAYAVAKQLGFERLTGHTPRHTLANHLLKDDYSVEEIQKVLVENNLDPNICQLAVDTYDKMITKELAEHTDVKLIDFTGNSAFGSYLEALPGKTVFTEKTGVNSVILDSAEDIDKTAANLAFSASIAACAAAASAFSNN